MIFLLCNALTVQKDSNGDESYNLQTDPQGHNNTICDNTHIKYKNELEKFEL